MNSLTLLLVTVALVGLASAYPQPPYQKAVLQNDLTAMIQEAQEKAMLERFYKQFMMNQQQAKLQEDEIETTDEMADAQFDLCGAVKVFVDAFKDTLHQKGISDQIIKLVYCWLGCTTSE